MNALLIRMCGSEPITVIKVHSFSHKLKDLKSEVISIHYFSQCPNRLVADAVGGEVYIIRYISALKEASGGSVSVCVSVCVRVSRCVRVCESV